MINLIANHLWQSTLFAVACGALTLALRSNRAQVRYGVWLAASLKFFVPFTLLVVLGSQVSWRVQVPVARRVEVRVVIDALTGPFSQPALRPTATGTPGVIPHPLAVWGPTAVMSIWLTGVAAFLFAWSLKWRRIARVVRDAQPIGAGREGDIFRRLEHRCGRGSLTLLASSDTMEPGVFGILNPVVLWPCGISAHLSDEQIEAILTHELAHVTRRDNLAALGHMAVQAVFWFHPLVWWIGARLVEERERACDEDVIRLGHPPEVYAESIVKTCRFSIESPLACVAGVTGSDLKRRIEAIMSEGVGETLNTSRRLMLVAVAIGAVLAPVGIGALSGQRVLAQAPVAAQGAATPKFEVASIKPHKSSDGRIMIGMQPGGRFTATNIPLRQLIRMAYQLQDFQVIGGPDWTSETFDVNAKAESDMPPAQPGLMGAMGRIGPMQLMLQSMLAERFNLAAHQETREMPVYALILARSDGKLGAQLHPSTVDCQALGAANRARGGPPAPPEPGQRMQCGMRMFPGNMSGGGFPLSQFAVNLSQFVQRIVLDRTGLSGNYDIDLTWTPEQMSQMPPGQRPPGAPDLPPIDPNGPSLFTALQEQLGLKLESTKSGVDVLVIDRIEALKPD